MTTPSVSVCIPARNEDATIGDLVRAVRQHPWASEVLVFDHSSTDDTAERARTAGAQVIPADSVLAGFGPALGKGDVLWRSVHAASCDVIVWLDADLRSYSPDYLTLLVEPMNDDAIAMVRPDYQRTLHGRSSGGGRITESVAKPGLRQWHPHLSHIRQPLAGEYAIRREVAETLDFEIDYGVEVGLLIDTAKAFGVESIAQVRLPARVHRNRPSEELCAPAQQVQRTILSRVGLADRYVRPALAGLHSSTAAT